MEVELMDEVIKNRKTYEYIFLKTDYLEDSTSQSIGFNLLKYGIEWFYETNSAMCLYYWPNSIFFANPDETANM